MLGVGTIIVIIGFIGWYFLSTSALKKNEKGAIETAKDASKSVPEIQTNLGEKVPEINPLDRANPFKYKNPLR